MKINDLKDKKLLTIIISSIALFVAVGLGVTLAWITGAFDSGNNGIKNPITYVNIVGTNGPIVETLQLNGTSIEKAISFQNNSTFDVQIEEVLVSITFYENETKRASGEAASISVAYDDSGVTKYHVTPQTVDGWTTTDNIKYEISSDSLKIIKSGESANFITGFALSNIVEAYNFLSDGTICEIFISITTSPAV